MIFLTIGVIQCSFIDVILNIIDGKIKIAYSYYLINMRFYV